MSEATQMSAKHILAALSAVFLIAAAMRWRRHARHPDPAARTWFLVALIFLAVAAWLQWHTS